MVSPDDKDWFHTHPALAFRVILRGGYVEELHDGTKKTWYPGMMGWVRPELCHRIDSFLNGKSSTSLWFRGRITHQIYAGPRKFYPANARNINFVKDAE